MVFSVCIIARNEEKTLPNLLKSLEEFKNRGGEVVIVDTGSNDKTVEIAKAWGCKVTEVEDRFVTTINSDLAKKINKRFVVDNEKPIVNSGDKLFDFASARNFSASLASNDMICTLDCDEAYTKFDLDKIEQFIKEGYEQFEYSFIFAHDPYGRPAVEFVQSKFFNRKKVKWQGVVHEILEGPANIKFLDRNIILLEHWQEPNKEHRGKYLTGLAWDCYMNPDKDRQSHYLGREFVWTGRPKSAIKELERHIEMNGWPQERAQSMIFIGDAYGQLNEPDKQAEWYSRAFYNDCSRREALIKLAEFYQHNDNKLATDVFATAALEVGFTPYYANDISHYQQRPHELLYWAKGWLGDIEEAQEHLLKALEYQPLNPKILDDTKYYFDYPDNKIEGWMTFPELQFLYNTAKKMDTICEVGSWKGRSTHALCTGCKKGQVTAVDHFEGSKEELDATHGQKGVYEDFMKNMSGFTNLTVNKKENSLASKEYKDKSFDMVFVDAGHSYNEVKEDIKNWKSKAKIMLCGHDYSDTWPGVMYAVDEMLGGPDGVEGSIWYKWIIQPKVSIVIPTLGRPEKLNRLLTKIRENAGYSNYEVIVEQDQFPPNNQGAPKMVKQGVEKSTGELVMFLGNDCIPEKDFLQLAVFRMIKNFPDLDGLVGLNDEYWEGEFATHWLASKKLLPYLGGAFFYIGYYHTGCDNELTEMCRKIGKYVWAEESKVYHDHPIQTGFKPETFDEVYKLAYRDDRRKHDNELLHKRAKLLGFEVKENFTDPKQPEPPKPPSEIEVFTEMIKTGKNFSFVKIGDGEISCMNGVKGTNCDKHPYTPKLAKALKLAYRELNAMPDTYIPIWGDYMEQKCPVEVKGNVDAQVFLHTSVSKEKYRFYETLKFSPRKKIYIGPEYLKEVKDFLNADKMIIIPAVNSFSYDFNIEPEENAIYMFTAGMASKVWIAQLLKKNPNITCIDFGSAFDPIFWGKNRTRQLDIKTLRDYYWGLIEGNYLDQLAYKYKSDKTPLLNHGYTNFYHKLFKDKRKKIKKVLEIGIGNIQIMKYDGYVTGASLYMWRDYFPKAEIYACDIDKSQLFQEERIHTFECDQSQSSQLFWLIERIGGGNFDLIVDDGSHIADHQIISARALIPFVKEGGIYVIEDVSQPEKVISGLPEYKCEVIIYDPNKPDDRLIIIQR